MKVSIVVILFALCFNNSFSQNFPSWEAFYQGSGDNSDKINKIISDGFGNFICVGYTMKEGNYKDALIFKINANSGDTMWWRTKNGKGNGDDEAVSAGIDQSGNIFITGTVDADQYGNNILVMKFDTQGIALWDTTWDSPYSLNDEAVDLVIDANGNCIVGGNAKWDTVTGSRNMITIKFNPFGHVDWDTTYDVSSVPFGKDELSDIAVDANGDIYVTGLSNGGSGGEDIVTIKYAGINGDELWRQRFPNAGDDKGTAIEVNHAGEIIVAGYFENNGDEDFKIIKYDNLGSFVWDENIGGPAGGDDRINAMVIDASDNIYATGSGDVASGPTINLDFQTVKYSTSSALQWIKRKTIPIPQDDVANAIALDGAGNIYITGKSDSNQTLLSVNNRFMTMSYDPGGNERWGEIYHDGTRFGDDDVAASLVTDNSGNVYVAGHDVNLITQKDARIIKYDGSNGNVIWGKSHNGEGDFTESAKVMCVDNNYNSYVAGYSFGENNNLDGLISKVDAAGNVTCTYVYRGFKNDDDEFNAIALSSTGFIYAAGYTKVIDQKRNALLVKFDPAACDTVWTKTYDYIGQSDRWQLILLDPQGNIFVSGRSDANPHDTIDNDDVVTFKYDTAGNVLNSTRFNGGGNLRDEPVKMIFDNHGDILVAGRTENTHDDFLVIKYDLNLSPVWSLPIFYNSNFNNDDRVTDIVVDASDNIYVAGFSQIQSGTNTPNAPVIKKYNSAGQTLGLDYPYLGGGKDEYPRIAIDQYEEFYALNKYDINGDPDIADFNYRIMKFDNLLSPLPITSSWLEPQYDSPNFDTYDDIPVDMILPGSADIYLTGTSDNDSLAGKINKNWVTLGYNDQGIEFFNGNYDPHGLDDSPNQMIIRGDNLWVCGYTRGLNNSQKDMTVINYNLLGVGIAKNDIGIKSTVYPNPFSVDCNIQFESDLSSMYLELYDFIGNQVKSPQLITGNSIRIQKGNLTPGIYNYCVKDKTTIISNGKLVIM